MKALSLAIAITLTVTTALVMFNGPDCAWLLLLEVVDYAISWGMLFMVAISLASRFFEGRFLYEQIRSAAGVRKALRHLNDLLFIVTMMLVGGIKFHWLLVEVVPLCFMAMAVYMFVLRAKDYKANA